jgi:hypothetical protein
MRRTHAIPREAAMEPLEPRCLLAGMTLIAHGVAETDGLPAWTTAMRQAIEARIGASAVATLPFLFNQPTDGSDPTITNLALGQLLQTTTHAEAVGVLDWADASNEYISDTNIFTSTSVAIGMFDLFIAADPLNGFDEPIAELPIHLIGHGRGASLVSELARLLGEQGIWVDQITLLDPHPLTSQDPFVELFEIDAGIQAFSNVAFVDDYYRFGTAPDGEPAVGAWNVDLTGLPGIGHEPVHTWYHGTADLTDTFVPSGETVNSAWYGTGAIRARDQNGWGVSRLGGTDRAASPMNTGLSSTFGGGATRSNPAIAGAGQWPNVADVRLSGGNALRAGQLVQVNFRFGDRDSGATVEFYLDTDENPYNAGAQLMGSRAMSQSVHTDGSVVLDLGATAPGAYRVMAKVTDGVHTRYAYVPGAVTVAATPPIGTTRLYFPEGYRSGTINEYVPMVNANAFAVEFQVIARYEVGERDQVLYTGTLLPGRDGITITEFGNPGGALVRADVGYALEVRASAAIGAMMSHYDFGVATGEAFTSQTSTNWYFPNVRKDTATTRDFITWFNPSATDGLVTITVFEPGGATESQTWSLFGLRRGGMTVDGEPWIPQGDMAILITTTVPVVASISHYEVPTGQGYIALGESAASSANGQLAFTDLDVGMTFTATFFNPGTSSVLVDIDKLYEGGAGLDGTQPIIVPARTAVTLNDLQLALVRGRRGVLRYTASSAIIVSSAVTDAQRGDGLGVPAATRTATGWLFADGYMPLATAGSQHVEFLSLMNPGAAGINVTVTYFYFGGETDSAVVNVPAGRSATIALHEDPQILEWGSRNGGLNWFSIRVASNAGFSASMIHWDLQQLGGWQALGTPIGALTLL